MRSLAELGLDALAILNDSPAVTYVVSLEENEAKLSFVSQSVRQVLGYSPDEFFKTPGFLASIIHPDDVDSLRSAAEDARFYGSAVRDRRMRTASGHYRWFRDRFRVVRDQSGKESHGVGSIVDVTGERDAQQTLEARQAEFRILADHSHDLISRVSVNGTFLYQSPSAKRVMGFEGDARIGQSSLGQVHPSDIAEIERAWRAALKTRAAQQVNYRAFHADGHWITLEAVVNPVVDPATNQVTEFVIYSRDVTERMAAEKRLAEAQEKIEEQSEVYDLFAHHGSDFFVRLTMDGHISHISPSHERIIGAQPAMYEGAMLCALVHPDDLENTKNGWIKALSDRAPQIFRSRLRHELGHWVWLETELTPILGADGATPVEVIALSRDVSGQVSSDLALADAQAKIREQSELYDLFANQGSDIFLRFTVDGVVLHTSPSHTRILGKGTLVEDGRLLHMIHPDDRRFAEDSFKQAFKTKAPVTYRHRYLHEAGHYLWIEITLTPILSEATGKVAEYIAVARDVDEKVRRDAQLETARRERDESRAELRLVTDNIADIVTLLRPDGSIAYMSPSALQVIGYEPAELMRPDFRPISHPDDRHIIENEKAGNRHGHVTPSLRYRLQHKDGRWLWMERRASAVLEHGFGAGVAVLSIIRDITLEVEREQDLAAAQRAMDISRTRLQLVADNIADIVMLVRPDMTYEYISPSVQKVIGYTAEEIMAPGWQTIVEPADRLLAEEEIRLNRLGHITPVLRYRLRHRDGRLLWVERRASAVPGAAFGQGSAILSIIRDVTASVEDEQGLASAALALEQGRTKLQSIVDHSVDVIAVFNADRDLEYLSRSCELQSGYTVEEFLDGSANLTHPDDEALVSAALVREDQGSEGETFRYRGVRKDGRVIWLERRARKVYDAATGELQNIVTVTRDISEDVRHEEEMAAAAAQLERSKIAAEAANVAKSQFLATMSHELRTPMTGVMGMLDLIKGAGLSGEQRHFVDLAYESAESLLAILNDILDFSKIEAGQMTITPEPFALRGEVSRVSSLLGPVADKRGNTLEIAVADAVEDKLLGDASRIRQILFNLMGNAIKFTSEGLVRLSIEKAGRGVRFEVRDTGAGIPPAAIEKLFKPFVQVDGSSRRKAGGTGLGLAICKSLVEAMGGTIGLDSQLGVGSTFWFELPLPAVEAPAAAPALAAKPGAPATRRRFNILVAEDHPVNQQLIAALLKREGHRVTIVANGRLAVEAVQAASYDLILMDVQMPVLDGPGATQEIRKLAGPVANIPIVAVTANALRGDMANYLAAGMNAYVSKPIRIDLLREAIEGVVPRSEDGARLAG